ncbi:hypothetical protein CRG98_037142 [Punica granatum]|uniref:Uncharacterized protein n=1 Tax=Punica granatum TaxID=22663 RepID=A0A2I0IEN3_PUNGR|nr:hypothetical protein CRG98_037142 [Punica granatum]
MKVQWSRETFPQIAALHSCEGRGGEEEPSTFTEAATGVRAKRRRLILNGRSESGEGEGKADAGFRRSSKGDRSVDGLGTRS